MSPSRYGCDEDRTRPSTRANNWTKVDLDSDWSRDSCEFSISVEPVRRHSGRKGPQPVHRISWLTSATAPVEEYRTPTRRKKTAESINGQSRVKTMRS
jgi:hypothetical protein